MPRRILITGQDKALHMQLQLHLAASGYDARLASQATTGLAPWPTDHVDLIIHELDEPTLDGLEDLARMSSAPGPLRPVIIVLADVAPADAEAMAAGLGVDFCLPKPVDVGVVLDLVRHAFCPARQATAPTWFIEDEPLEASRMESGQAGISAPEDPGSVTFH